MKIEKPKIDLHKLLSRNKYSLIDCVYAVDDECKLYLEQKGNNTIQKMISNGWTYNHYVDNLIMFTSSEFIMCCTTNALGTMQNSQICDFGSHYDLIK